MEKPRIQVLLFGMNDVITTSSGSYPYKVSGWNNGEPGDLAVNGDKNSSYLVDGYMFYFKENYMYGEVLKSIDNEWDDDQRDLNDETSPFHFHVDGDYRQDGNNLYHREWDQAQ